MIQNLFGFDATMEIVKTKSTIPNISVIVASNSEFNDKNLSNKISDLIQKDLQVSGHFQNSKILIESDFNRTPRYKLLKQNAIDLYLVIFLKRNQIGGIVVSIKLYDINTNTIVMNKSYSSSNEVRYPFLAHKIDIDINEYLNAPSIEWMEKLVIFSRYLSARESEIVVSDYTLTYQKVVVKGNLNIFPKWANNKQESFYYTTYRYNQPTLIKQNLYTKKSKIIISSDGMMICSDVSNDGNKLILTMAPNSQPDIYLYDIDTKLSTRITKYKGIDVSGNFVENDTKIVFVSDRLKYPNIFSKRIGYRGVERLIYHGKNNSQSTTFQDYIVYSSRETDNEFGKNTFNLYLISTTSDYIRRPTTTGLNQFPKFSSDGETILFIKRYKGKSYLNLTRLNYNKSFKFPLKSGKLQSIDW